MKNVLRDKNVKIHVHAGGILNIFDGQTNYLSKFRNWDFHFYKLRIIFNDYPIRCIKLFFEQYLFRIGNNLERFNDLKKEKKKKNAKE